MGHPLCGSTPGPPCPEPCPCSGLMKQPRVSIALGCFLLVTDEESEAWTGEEDCLRSLGESGIAGAKGPTELK